MWVRFPPGTPNHFPQIMNDSNANLAEQVASLARAMKIGFLVIFLAVFYLNARCTLFMVPRFEQIYHDMLGGKPLPSSTALVIQHHGRLFIMDLALLLGALAALRIKNPTRSILTIIAIIAVQIIQLLLVSDALMAPLVSIVQTMSGGS